MLEIKEEDYKRFSSSLIPDIEEGSMLGIRLPQLRKLSRKICRDDPDDFIKNFPEEYFEDIMLKGFVIGEADYPFCKEKELVSEHIPKINNWSLCDSFCSSLKFVKKNKAEFLKFLLPYFDSFKEFESRFAIVALLDYYNDKERVKENLELISSVKAAGFYADMAKAWAVSQIFVVSPGEVYEFLEKGSFDDFTHNKTISKIRESLKVGKEDKQKILKLKR